MNERLRNSFQQMFSNHILWYNFFKQAGTHTHSTMCSLDSVVKSTFILKCISLVLCLALNKASAEPRDLTPVLSDPLV